ncbi:hypothetical protein AMS68_001223 [Peltaster fructicola]|uniref:Cyclin-D1-binding protein 1-like N-terminal domain-containing protein n=1 Tax=Peltaster fructicola TaxID=286661 RepID=A0A6H0XLX6_9PEZI|nr:hypothetical protein AMS68_001223 [Peltaster fructicola]
MPPQPSLEQTLATTDTLLSQYLEVLGPNKAEDVTLSDPPAALPLLSDCARLLKAQVTKLSLLAINKPFTPSAISSVLRDTTTSCLPAMMSAVQICETQRDMFGGFFVDEIRGRVRRVVREMLGLVQEVTSIANEAAQKNAQGRRSDNGGRDSLSSTGIVWSGCDDLITLTTTGVAGLAVHKAEAYRDMISDAIAELQEWREGEDTENEGIEDNLLDSDDEGVDGDRDSLNDLFNAANSLPADRVQLRKLVEEAESKLKKVVLLYTALIKRRIKQFPAQPTASDADVVRRLNSVTSSFKQISNMVDDMASSFYDLDEELAEKKLHDLLGQAMSCADIMEHNVKDKEDEFTNWLTRWKEAISSSPEDED